MISGRLPGTHLDRMAQLRINQLPKTAEDLQEQQTVSSIHMPALSDHLDDPLPPEPTAPNTPVNDTVPNALNIRKMARVRPASPTRLTMNAFCAATAALFRYW